MILSKYIKWLGPYLDAVDDLVELDKIKEIKLTFYKENKWPSDHGECEKVSANKYKIKVKCYKRGKVIPMPWWAQEQLLINLAHELSHCMVWEHTPQRFVLEGKIYQRFTEVLNKLNYEVERNKA